MVLILNPIISIRSLRRRITKEWECRTAINPKPKSKIPKSEIVNSMISDVPRMNNLNMNKITKNVQNNKLNIEKNQPDKLRLYSIHLT